MYVAVEWYCQQKRLQDSHSRNRLLFPEKKISDELDEYAHCIYSRLIYILSSSPTIIKNKHQKYINQPNLHIAIWMISSTTTGYL